MPIELRAIFSHIVNVGTLFRTLKLTHNRNGYRYRYRPKPICFEATMRQMSLGQYIWLSATTTLICFSVVDKIIANVRRLEER